MTVETFPSLILVTDLINGQLVKEKYIGYTEKQAKKLFKKKYGKRSTRRCTK